MKNKNIITNEVVWDNVEKSETSIITTVFDKILVWALPILIFFAITANSAVMTLIFVGLAVVLCIGKAPWQQWNELFCLPALGLVIYAIINGLASLYAGIGEYGAKELLKILGTLAVALIVLVRLKKENIRQFLWGFVSLCAVISLICLDSAGEGAVYYLFCEVMSIFGVDYKALDVLFQANQVRISGIFDNANLTANLLGLAMLIGLYLLERKMPNWKRWMLYGAIGLIAQGFLLSMSRGAIISFGIACVVYFVLSTARTSFFLRLLALTASTLIIGIFIIPLLPANIVLAVLLAVLSGGIWLVLDLIVQKLNVVLAQKGKLLWIVCGIVLVALLVYLVIGMKVTKPYIFTENDVLFDRIIELDAGEYHLAADYDGSITVVLSSQTKQEVLLDEVHQLYTGPLQEAQFTVPKDTVVINVRIFGEIGNTLYSLTVSDGTTVPLRYTMLPEFVADRLQGNLFLSNSFLLRWQFFIDGLKVFAMNPLIGMGLGATETWLTSVQPFFYQTLYLHNHYIQCLTDMGILGFFSFMMILGGCIWLVIKNCKDSMAPMWLSVLIMIAVHAFMEITLSARVTQIASFTLFAAIIVQYGNTSKIRFPKWLEDSFGAAFLLFFLVFGTLFGLHYQVQKNMQNFSTDSAQEFLSALEKSAKLDKYDNTEFQLTYVASAAFSDSAIIRGAVPNMVKDLRKSGCFDACSGLTRYYYFPKGDLEEAFKSSREAIAQEASVADAWNIQFLNYQNEGLTACTQDNVKQLIEGVLGTVAYLEEYNAGRMQEVALTEGNLRFVEAVKTASTLPDEAALMLLKQTISAPLPVGE